MSTMTAHLAVGTPDPYHGGIRPTHLLWLSENGRASWHLEAVGAAEAGDGDPPVATAAWVATEELLEDALLMVAIDVLRDDAVRALAEASAPALLGPGVTDLNELPAEELSALRELSRTPEASCKLTLTLLEGSSLAADLGALESYGTEVEVCSPVYSRLSRGALGFQERGSFVAPDSVAGLLARSREILRQLREQGVIRTLNAPAGDYAEWLVWKATDGVMEPPSQKSWDVTTPAGERLQVKARVVSTPPQPGQTQLSAFRSWDFDAAVIVLFDDDLQIARAVRVPVEVVKDLGAWIEHVHGWRVFANQHLLDHELAEDWTERLGDVASDA